MLLVLLGWGSNQVHAWTPDAVEEGGTIGYFLWLDINENNDYDIGEKILKNFRVGLYDASKGKLLEEQQVIDEGRFYFKNIRQGKYYLLFSFDKIEYEPTGELFNDNLKAFFTEVFDYDPTTNSKKIFNIPFRTLPTLSSLFSSVMCTDFIDTSFVEVTIENCDNVGTICLTEPISEMLNYLVTDNGMTYTNTISPCDFDTSFAYTYSAIPGGGAAGPYHIDAWTVDGFTYTGTVQDMAALTDSMNIWNTGGNWMHDILTASIRGGNASLNYSAIDITQVASGTSNTINLSTTLNPNGSLMVLDTGYHELIFTDPIDGCMDTLIAQINCTACPELYDGNMDFTVANCNNDQLICIDIPFGELGNYGISDNGFSYTGSMAICSLDSFYQYDYAGLPGGGFAGPYLLQNWTINGTVYLGGFNDIGGLVDSMNVWDFGGNWSISDPEQTITGGNPANMYSDIEVVQILSGTNATAPVTQIASATSFEMVLDTGFHQLVFYNNENECRDTLDFSVLCAPCPEYLNDTLIMLTAVHCDSSTNVCLPIPENEAADYNWFVNNIPYGGITSCSVNQTQIQLDTGVWKIFIEHNISGCMDSATIVIDCIPPVICTDFIALEESYLSTNDCDMPVQLCTEISFNDLADYSITDNGTAYTGMTSDCTPGSSIELDTGWHEIIFTHNLDACSDTLNVLVACLINDSLETYVLATEFDTLCIDTTELPGTIISFDNICTNASGELSLITLDAASYCVYIEGVEMGSEMLCLELCDDLGYCDTTFININVDSLLIEPELAPIALSDDTNTPEGENVIIDVLSNDQINGVLNSFGILEAPDNGTVNVLDNYEVEYIPALDYCSTVFPDSFTYVLCNEVGCDEAVVRVNVECSKLIVYNGFSPNGDGQNEYFVINGADRDPDNQLTVFNRWGARVFYTQAYQNNWNGTWEGIDLPDGTYFYHFVDGNGSTATGYVLIQR